MSQRFRQLSLACKPLSYPEKTSQHPIISAVQNDDFVGVIARRLKERVKMRWDSGRHKDNYDLLQHRRATGPVETLQELKRNPAAKRMCNDDEFSRSKAQRIIGDHRISQPFACSARHLDL